VPRNGTTLAERSQAAPPARRLGVPKRLAGFVRDSGPLPWTVAVVLVGFVFGMAAGGNYYFDWTYALIEALFAFGTAMAISWAGVPSFGQALYFAAGGYTTALMVNMHLPLILTLIIGAAVAGLIALVFGGLALRLSFHSFAMLSLVVAQAGNQLIYTVKQLGGENGLFGVQRPSAFGLDFSTDEYFFYYCLIVLAIVVLLGRMLFQSTTGRQIRATRDDFLRAQALGTNITRVRLIGFVAGGAVCGVAGVLYAQLQGVVDPSMGDFLQSTVGVMMVVIGGLGTFFGAVIGGLVYGWFQLFLTNNTQAPSFWLGIVFTVIVLVMPAGRRAVLWAVHRVRGDRVDSGEDQ
jgi:branched-chain amino acid transport system permease protein